jgi:hypothetical protein
LPKSGSDGPTSIARRGQHNAKALGRREPERACAGIWPGALRGSSTHNANARPIWSVEADPGAVSVRVAHLFAGDGDRIDLYRLADQVTLAIAEDDIQRALVTELDDLDTSAPLVEHASLTHETLYTRLFRS